MATNKLRKRLEDADEKTLSRMTENFCMIGTPLPALDGKRDANEYKPIWEQEVRDDQGRRRFHGAFTGGFSAGYYNSVGSKEGWTPSAFRSSRKDKERKAGEESSGRGSKNAFGQKPEDFMDDEDLEALKEARGVLGNTQTYQMEERQKLQRERDPLMDMLGVATTPRVDEGTESIQLASTSLGIRLLQRMGWKSGQGLGPKVSFAKRLKMLSMLGIPLADEEKNDEEASKHLWPPPDTPMPVFNTKTDSKGLGYVSESQGGGAALREALRRARAEEEKKSRSGVKKAGGFGLGALEVDSDGEDDVYANSTRIEESTLGKRSITRWDSNTDQIILSTSDKRKSKASQASTGDCQKNGKIKDQDTWHDGRPMLPGFRIASLATLENEPWFEAPEVPKGWKPNPQQIWNQAERRIQEHKTNMTSEERASILGEARLPGPPPSILNYLSQKDKERLERGKAAAAAMNGNRIHPESIVIPKADIPTLDAEVARLALQGYMPFASEPEKQSRYRRYLQSQSETESKITLQPSDSQSDTQFLGELREFAKSASIFKPLSTVMASRFQSSNSGGGSDLPAVNPGLYIPERKSEAQINEEKARTALKREKEEKEKREEMSNLTSLQRNAKLGLFGKETTREVKIWKPARLLCKRFNIPPPYPEEDMKDVNQLNSHSTGTDDMEAAFGHGQSYQMNLPKINARWEESKKQLQQLASLRANEQVQSEEFLEDSQKKLIVPKETTIGYADVGNIGLGEVKQDAIKESEYVKPSIDIFKAVFADNDDDDDDEEDEKDEGEKEGEEVANNNEGFIMVRQTKKAPEANGEAFAGSREAKTNGSTASSAHVAVERPSDGIAKPLFIPRKRNAEDTTPKKEIMDDKRKKKNKTKSLLTFSMDEDGLEVDREKTSRTKDSGIAQGRTQHRPKASDLFN